MGYYNKDTTNNGLEKNALVSSSVADTTRVGHATEDLKNYFVLSSKKPYYGVAYNTHNQWEQPYYFGTHGFYWLNENSQKVSTLLASKHTLFFGSTSSERTYAFPNAATLYLVYDHTDNIGNYVFKLYATRVYDTSAGHVKYAGQKTAFTLHNGSSMILVILQAGGGGGGAPYSGHDGSGGGGGGCAVFMLDTSGLTTTNSNGNLSYAIQFKIPKGGAASGSGFNSAGGNGGNATCKLVSYDDYNYPSGHEMVVWQTLATAYGGTGGKSGTPGNYGWGVVSGSSSWVSPVPCTPDFTYAPPIQVYEGGRGGNGGKMGHGGSSCDEVSVYSTYSIDGNSKLDKIYTGDGASGAYAGDYTGGGGGGSWCGHGGQGGTNSHQTGYDGYRGGGGGGARYTWGGKEGGSGGTGYLKLMW